MANQWCYFDDLTGSVSLIPSRHRRSFLDCARASLRSE